MLSACAMTATETSLLTFPCAFPLKVMGINDPDLVTEVCSVALQFDPSFQSHLIELRPSKGGNYVGITLNIHATSKIQLDDLYRALSSHRLVKVVL